MGLRQIWYKGAYEMNSELTPEKVMELGEKWIDMILASLPPEKVLKYVEPEDRLRGLTPEEIETYLRKLKTQKKLDNGGRQIES